MVNRMMVVLMGCLVAIAGSTFATSCVAQVVVKPAKPVAKAAAAQEIRGSEYILPTSTKLWISVPNGNELEARFKDTRFAALANDPAIKPFVESLRNQAQEWMKTQNFRLGVELDELHDIDSGEICIAGVVQKDAGGKVKKGSHGVVLLVDVSKTYDAAKKLQAKITAELRKNKAEIKTNVINGTEVITSTIKRKRVRKNQSTHQAIVNKKWMLISDNDEIFREILRRLSGKIAKGTALADHLPFKTVMKETVLKEQNSQIRWFIDPFGYVELAKALEAANRPNQEPTDDWAEILKKQGLGAARGIGGNIAVSTGEHELLHRTFTYAPRKQTVKNAKRMFELFDFRADINKPLTPPVWVPKDSSSYMIGNWQLETALGGFGHVYDAFIEEDGSFERLLSDFKTDPDMQLDIKALVGMIDNRFTIISASEKPIDGSSERIVVGFPIKKTGTPDFVFESLLRATSGEKIKLGGVPVIKIESDDSEAEEETFDIPDELNEEDEEAETQFSLFEQRFITVVNGNLLIANNKDFLKKLLIKKKSGLATSPDYMRVRDELAKMVDENKVGWRHFSRIDKVLETNYEMLRRGEMGQSKTVLAKIVNQIFKKETEKNTEKDPENVRKQKLDGSKLPGNYATQIAPYFGPMGWVLETEENGWRITGCVLKKKGVTEVVRKVNDSAKSQR